MQRGLIFAGIFIFVFMSQISADCDEGQIDINSASLEELDELYGIGPSKAQAIIDSRPFDSVDDIIDVYGIGGIILEKIKAQNLACVDKEKKKSDSEEKEDISEEDEEKESEKEAEEKPKEDILKEESIKETQSKNVIREVISLKPDTKDIKKEKNNEKTSVKNYSLAGLVLFFFIIGGLYLIREKRRYKNEFKE